MCRILLPPKLFRLPKPLKPPPRSCPPSLYHSADSRITHANRLHGSLSFVTDCRSCMLVYSVVYTDHKPLMMSLCPSLFSTTDWRSCSFLYCQGLRKLFTRKVQKELREEGKNNKEIFFYLHAFSIPTV